MEVEFDLVLCQNESQRTKWKLRLEELMPMIWFISAKKMRVFRDFFLQAYIFATCVFLLSQLTWFWMEKVTMGGNANFNLFGKETIISYLAN